MAIDGNGIGQTSDHQCQGRTAERRSSESMPISGFRFDFLKKNDSVFTRTNEISAHGARTFLFGSWYYYLHGLRKWMSQ
jgi:hypothetical protein